MLFFEDLVDGWTHPAVPFRVTAGHTGWFQAFAGDQLRWCRDQRYARRWQLPDCPVNPALIASIVIGQSTAATRAVVANLYYDSVIFHRPVLAGESVTTTVRVLAGQEATPRPDRPPRGKVLLGIDAVDAEGAPLVTMVRCALVRKKSAQPTGRAGPLSGAPTADFQRPARRRLPELSADLGPAAAPDPPTVAVGQQLTDDLTDPVTDALGLVRLTGNEAAAHRDARMGQGARRLVYGGHTQALAQAALSRMVPALLDVVGWRRLEHPAPVFEDDQLASTATLTELTPLGPAWLAEFDVRTVRLEADPDANPTLVQHWTPIVLLDGDPGR